MAVGINMQVYVLTGPVRSGKTTFMVDIFQHRDDVGGFLTPDIEGKRYFNRLDTKELLPFEINEDETNAESLKIGKYSFDKSIFRLGNQMISGIFKSDMKYFIIDEVGKLEVAGLGFSAGLREIFLHDNHYSEIKIILIIRDYLVGEVTKMYNLEPEIFDIKEKDLFLSSLNLKS